MKAKLDENLDVRLAGVLLQHGVDAATVFSEKLSGASDDEVFAASRNEGRTLITLDLDFADPLRYPPAATPGVVVLRPPRAVFALVRELLLRALPAIQNGPVEGKLWIVEPTRIRVYDPGER
jgi:predicted nuclease of predicted toxin-antitoxin system